MMEAFSVLLIGIVLIILVKNLFAGTFVAPPSDADAEKLAASWRKIREG